MPYCTELELNKQLERFWKLEEPEWSLASEILWEMMYVDDALAGAHIVSGAIEARKQLRSALSSAGFSMRKWTSNDRRIIQGLPSDHLLREDFLEFEDVSFVRSKP